MENIFIVVEIRSTILKLIKKNYGRKRGAGPEDYAKIWYTPTTPYRTTTLSPLFDHWGERILFTHLMKVNNNKASMGPASINANCFMSCPFSTLRKFLWKRSYHQQNGLLNSRKILSERKKTWNYRSYANINFAERISSICCIINHL